MRATGINRVSFGAQSFSPRILQFLGRIHSAEQTVTAVEQARGAGFDQLNLDLIFAVPGQELDDVAADLEQASKLCPDHISAYNLTFEEGTAFGAALKAGRMRQLPEERQAAMYEMVRRELPRRGYAMYEISNYARPGCEARHNLTYWRGESYLAVGAGAHSYAAIGSGGRRWWNERLPAVYAAKARQSRTAEAGSETLEAEISASEFAFCNLRLIEGLELSRFSERFGTTFEERFGARAQRLFDGGLLARDGGRVRLDRARFGSRRLGVRRIPMTNRCSLELSGLAPLGGGRGFLKQVDDSLRCYQLNKYSKPRTLLLTEQNLVQQRKDLAGLVVVPTAHLVDCLFDFFPRSRG